MAITDKGGILSLLWRGKNKFPLSSNDVPVWKIKKNEHISNSCGKDSFVSSLTTIKIWQAGMNTQRDH